MRADTHRKQVLPRDPAFAVFSSLAASPPAWRMLKAKLLPQVLQQACNNGVKASLYASSELSDRTLTFRSLLTQEGSIVAAGGADQSKAAMVSAIAANMWTSYEKSGGELSVLLVDCEVRRTIRFVP